jgi:60S ribosomal protein uL30
VKGEDVKIKRPEQFVREFRIVSKRITTRCIEDDGLNGCLFDVQKQGSENKMKRRQKLMERRTSKTVNKMLTQSTVGLVIRIHAGKHSSEDIKKALKKLDLKNKYDAVFVRLDEERLRELKALDAYVAYGYISRRSVEELIHRRAFTTATVSTGGTKMPLSDNLTVEKLLGDSGIICVNDLCEEIYNVGPNFDAAIDILSPFVLSAPVGHFEKAILQKHDEVEDKAGFIENSVMEEFLHKIL